jgi:putative ABC transport system substrate-binding protein
MRRREFITLVGATSAFPFSARAQQPTMLVIGFLEIRSPETITERLRAFRQGLRETGYVEGENVTIDYRWAEHARPRRRGDRMRKRVTLYVLGSAALIWPLAAHAQSTTQPTQGTAANSPRIEMVRVKLIDQNAPEPRFQLRVASLT